MTQSLLIEAPAVGPDPAAAVADVQPLDLASLLGDRAARAQDDGQRRMLACGGLPAGASAQLCVAAWHAVLHWLSHHDEPATSVLRGARAGAGWPIVTRAAAQTPLGGLLSQVQAQWPVAGQAWPDLRRPEHAAVLEAQRCQSIQLDGADPQAAELALVRDAQGWHLCCAAARYSEAYQRSLIALWQRFAAALRDRPQALLSEHATVQDVCATRAGLTGPAVPLAGSLAQRFAAGVAAATGKTAVVDAQGSIGFAELGELSDAWAEALRAAGAGRGDHVGVAFDRRGGRAMVAAQLAVLKTGAAFVPMDATQPAQRLQAMAEDCDMRLALADGSATPLLRQALPGVHCLVADALPRTPQGRPELQAVTVEDAAYVIFTSGSTGKPKGVKVSHGNLLNFVQHLAGYIGPDEVLSQFAPFTFDASVAEIHAALLNGATVVVLADELIKDPERLQAHMREQRVTFAAFPPQYAQHLSPELLPGLKTLLTAGSAPDHALVARWQPRLRYINAYGPTETTILSTIWQPSRAPDPGEPIVIGTPICNTQVRVVNRFNQSLPPGVIGELLIGGEGVAHGYLKRESLTRERFITLDDTRWYRSGDLACLDDAGRLVFAGRVDNQVKLRGHRLEPGEVESALVAVEGVRQAAVAVHTDAAGGKQLVAFCVGAPMPEETMRERLAQLLPAWALPNRIVWTERLPLTTNGKTDYAQLLAGLAQSQARARAEAAPPVVYADALEAEVAAIWGTVLQHPRIQPQDHFVHLGGDSLTALVVASSVKRLGYALSATQLLQHPRLADCVALLRAQGPRREQQEDYASREGAAPLAPIQGWFFSLGLAHPGRLCQSLVFDSSERIDVVRLAQACSLLADHHDQLRAQFEFDAAAGRWQQTLVPAPLQLPALNVIEIADEMLDATAEAYCRRLGEELRLDAAPLFRLAVIHAPRRSRVVWVLHHLLVDSVSHGILLDDLQQLYSRPGRAVRDVLPGKSMAYGEWAGALQQRVQAQAASLLATWQPVLDAVSRVAPLPLLAATAAGAPQVVCQVRLSRAQTQQWQDAAGRAYRQSPEELVLAATCRALARSLNLERVAIDVEWHGRDDDPARPQGLDRTVGWFTSVHPLCVELPPGQPLAEALMALKEARAAVPRRGRDFYALRYLCPDAAVRAAFEHYRQPEVLFNFSGVLQRSPGAWRTAAVAAIEMGQGNAQPYALSVESEVRDGELVISCWSRAELWSAAALQRLSQALPAALQDIVQHCSDPKHRRWTPSDFPLLPLTQAQVDQLPQDARSAHGLTDMQHTMLRHKDTYQVHMCHRFPRRFDAQAWTTAVNDWVARHDCLRSHVKEWDDGSACQVVLESLQVPLAVHRAEPARARALADELVARGRNEPVRVDGAPLFALQVVDSGQDEFLLVLSIHHLIHDGWSIERLLGELMQDYRRALGEPVARPAPPLAGLADVVSLQQRLRASPQWQAHWDTLPWERSSSQLPATRRAAEGGVQAARTMQLHLGRIEPALAAAVRERAHALGVTVNSLWLAGYAALLRILGGNAHVRCGVIQSGRSDEIAGVETITGCCVNTLPLVLNIGPEQTPAGTVAEVHAQLQQMRACAAYPLSAIHERVKARVDGNLFDTLFNIESQRYGVAGDAERPQLLGGHEATNHDFIFGLIEQSGGADAAPQYQLRVGYDAALHDAASVAAWTGIYTHLMGLLAREPARPWRELPLLPPDQRERVVVQWNATDHAYRSDACIHDLVAEQVRRSPHAPALVYEDQCLSYLELDARANRLAQHLRTLGVGPEVVVGCCFERSLDMVVALLAVLKAGGAYVPLDPELPPARLAAMVADIATPLVLTQAALAAAPLAELQAPVRVVCLDRDAAQIAGCPATAPASGVTPQRLAYVIFTSGSTGKPKAAMNEHGALVNRLQWMQHAYPLDPSDRVLQKTPFSFDVSVWEFFWPLMTGAVLVIARPGGHRDPAYLGALIRSQRITTLHFVPSMLQAFVDAGELPACGTLRRVITSGEGLPGALTARFLEQSTAELHNLYGPTEAAIDVSHYTVRQAGAAVEPLGRPIWNTRLYVLDEARQPVPVGVSGELYIGGLAVGRGYLGRADLTAERFIASPFVAGERLYRTGDVARWREDGELEYLGRTDHQVKIRGLRIELGEIEHALCAHPAVGQAVVSVHAEGGRQQLVAHLLVRGGDAAVDRDALPAVLAQTLARTLPEYMVPTAYVLMDALPLNANGKVDRARLPAPGPQGGSGARHTPPAGPVETTLLGLWQEVLGSSDFGVTDAFYALGGDSILAIQVASRASRLGLPLQPRHVIEDKTIRRLAARLAPTPAAAVAAAASTPPAVPDAAAAAPAAAAAHGPRQLLPIQLQFLRGDALDQDQFGQLVRVDLPEHVDASRLKAALAAVLARHDVLRLCFEQADGTWVARLRDGPLPDDPAQLDALFDTVDLAGLDHGQCEARIDAARAHGQARLAIAEGRLMHWTWLRGGARPQLLWLAHHLVVDGVSWRTLLADLQALLAPQGADAAWSASPGGTSHQAWAALLHAHARGGELEHEKAHWLQTLELPSLSLLASGDGSAGEAELEQHTARVQVQLDAAQTARVLRELPQRLDARPHQVLLAALAHALGACLGGDAVRIDLEGHGRDPVAGVAAFDGADPGQAVGWFTSVYPVHLSALGTDPRRQLRRTCLQLAAVPHQGLGYGLLAELVRDEDLQVALEALGGRSSQVLFNYLGQFDAGGHGDGFVSPRRRRSHALRVNAWVQDGVLTLRLDHSAKQLDTALVESVARRTVQRLQALLDGDGGGPTGPGGEPRALAGLDAATLQALRQRHPALQDAYPCTGMQQGLLLSGAMMAGGDATYMNQLRLTLRGADPARLRRAWQQLAGRHAVLRTAFADVGGSRLLQLVLAEAPARWQELDLRHDADALQRHLAQEREQPFDIGQAPLVRLLLARCGDDEHVLCWTYHHALLDGWSAAHLVKELMAIYADQPLPQAPAFRAYIDWLDRRDHAGACGYWRRYLDGVSVGAASALPLAPRRGADAADAAPARQQQQAHALELPQPLTARLQTMAREQGVSLGTLVLAAWGLLLSKYNAETQVLFGYTTSGRPAELADVEHTAGLFINSLPICVLIDGGQTLADWLAQLQSVMLDHEDHGFVSLEDIRRQAQAQPGQPLFDSLVVVENYPLDRAAMAAQDAAGARLVDVQGVERNGLGLTLVVYPGPQLRLQLAYQAPKFDEATTAAMLRQFGQLLSGFADGGARTVAQLSILDAAERERALQAWNPAPGAYPHTQCIGELFDAQARLRGDATALVFGSRRCSYAALAQRAAAIAAWLGQQGVRPGDRVALSLEKGTELVAAMLGILCAGAAYVPIAADCPLERRAYIAQDAGIRHLLTRASLAAQLGVPQVQALALEDCPALPQDAPAAPAGSAQDTAYVIYTSGTTGTPKGVAISHRNLVNFASWSTQAARCRPGDRVSQFAPYTFDASAGEIFGSLIGGCELHLLEDALIQDPHRLAQYLREQDIHFAAFPPSYAQHLDPAQVPAHMTMLTAGSAPTDELVQRWGSQRRYINGYGPTETTILSSAWICEPGARLDGVPTIGSPIANTTMMVVDQVGQLCAPGLVGEIWIGGDGVAQGYVNQPALTAEKFIADPFREGGRVYRTGDLGRWREDGCIEFVGRRDRQVKLRGFRIELGEIEARLRLHPGVADCAVLVRGTGIDQQLLAWVVQRPQAAGLDGLREHLRQALPDYMLPQAIMTVERLPLTANGKLDEKALPSPRPESLRAGGHVAPRTATEALLAQAWAAVLKLQPGQVGADAHFFELGGQSLLAMRVVSRLREQTGLEIGVADLFTHPVLQDLARLMEGMQQHRLPPIERAPRDQPLPLSYAQQRLWFLDQLEGVSQSYAVAGTLRLRGTLDVAALQRALDRIVARHEVLRTRFEAAAGQPTQCIGPADTGLPLLRTPVAAAQDPEQQVQALLAQALAQPFDLAQGPLIRAHLLHLADDHHVLLLAMHHIVTDGWSLMLMVRELQALYNAHAAGRDDPLPPLALQYADYAVWQQRYLRDDRCREAADHWRRTLQGAAPLLELPTDRPRPAQQDYAGALHRFGFDAATSARIKALGHAHGVTPFMTFLAAWSVVLARLSGQQDLVVGTPVANRHQIETESMIGFFVNPLALRLDLGGDPTLAVLLQRVKQQVLDAQRHQQLPFEQVVELVQPPRCLAHTPLFQVMLNWLDEDQGDLALHGLQAAPLRPQFTTSKYDLTLDIGETAQGIEAVFEYATALFDAATVQRHAGYLQRVVEAMLADIGQPVAAVELPGEDEQRLLQAVNDTARPELYGRCWADLFDEQAARTPQRVAVRCAGRTLSYAGLHERATSLAAALVRRGAGPGRVVALLDERGIDLLVMIVAVLKAGAAYMPLDPAHPPQRWLDVLQDAQPCLLWVGPAVAAAAPALSRSWPGCPVLGADELLAAAPGAADVPARPAPTDLAYVLFTSGSTGRPKGVMVEQRGMVNNMRAKFEPLGLGADDVVAQTASQCFDISVWQFLTPLLLGARVLIVGQEFVRDPEALLAHLSEEGATIWEPVPSLLQAALEQDGPMPALRWVMPTGEALSRELVARWFARCPHIPLMNAYGPAECSDDVALQPLHGPVERVLIGRPVPNAQLHVLDAGLRRLPLGAVGELAVSGPVVGRGYIGRPQETQAAFRANPWATGEHDARLYLTGDLVRRWPDGSLEFVGRKDFQVKVRGFRIELGEIEATLARHPAVREALVMARASEAGECRLVAYVTLHDATGTDALLAHLRAFLPDYMVPAAIVVLQAMPLNGSGKVDRQALPEPGLAAYAHRAYEAPVGDTERSLAALWQQHLQLPQVGRGDCYFDLGGNSLQLVRILNELRQQGMELGVTEVYQLRTLGACAAAIDQRRAAVARQAGPAQARPRPEAAAASEQDLLDSLRSQLQARSRALAQAPVRSHLRFSPVQCNFMTWQRRDSLDQVSLTGPHDAAALQRAFAAVAAEQDMLRAALDDTPGRWQLLAPEAVAAAPVPHVDLGAHEPAAREALLRRLGAALQEARGDSVLAYEALIVTLQDGDHRVLLAIDHLVWDGLSVEVLQQRMQAHLLGLSAAPAQSWADHVEAAWRVPAADVVAALERAVDREALSAAMRATQQALAQRADAPLQHLYLGLAPDPRAGGPAEQAFAAFVRCVQQITGLQRFGMLLNHHGRQSGSDRWFDLVGVFLDKVPYAAQAGTTLAQLVERAGEMQSLGVNFLGLAQSPGSAWADILPPLESEVLFNYKAEAPQTAAAMEAPAPSDALDGFRGILVEAAPRPDRLNLHIAFRGLPAEAEALRAALAGAVAPGPAPSASVGDHGVSAGDHGGSTGWALQVRDVHKRYGGFHAVRGVSFSVRRGSCFGILGPNGAGKTSLLAMIEGLVPISAGAIEVLGRDVATEMPLIQPHVGVQLQQNNYFQFLSVAELLAFYQELRVAASGRSRGRPLATLLSRLDLQDKLQCKVEQLSGGQKQRLSIAIALLEDPDLVFLDEPTSALDPHSRIATWEFIEELRQDRSKTIVLTTHYMEEAERLCDEILLMDRGRVIAQGEPSRLVKSLAAEHTIRFQFGRGQFRPEWLRELCPDWRGDWDERSDGLQLHTTQVSAAISDVLSLGRNHRIDVLNVEINRPTLEDVFLSHTGKESAS